MSLLSKFYGNCEDLLQYFALLTSVAAYLFTFFYSVVNHKGRVSSQGGFPIFEKASYDSTMQAIQQCVCITSSPTSQQSSALSRAVTVKIAAAQNVLNL